MQLLLLFVIFFCIGCEKEKPPKGGGSSLYSRYVDVKGEDFIIIGDSGTGQHGQYKVGKSIENFCKVKSCDYGIILGDVIYENGITSKTDKQLNDKFERPYQNLSFTFYPVLGNHDHRGSWKSYIEYKSKRWEMPARYYKITTKLADIIGIDTQNFDVPQQKWLEQELKKSTKSWTFVYGHHPIYSSGRHGPSALMVKKLKPILKKYPVDMYMAGHDHHLEMIHKDGIKQLISGAAGKLRTHKPGQPGTIFSRSELGFAHMDLSVDKAILTFVDDKNKLLRRIEYLPVKKF